MSKKPFAPQGVALELPPKIIKTVEKLRDGRSLGKTRFTGKELNAIGLCYWYGHIVKTDYTEAVKWYLAADAKRYSTASFNLYVCYNNGMGVDEDGKQALYWLRKAARLNDAGAQNILAECYYTGGFVRRNRRLARLWFQKSLDNALKGNNEVTLNDFGAKYYLGRYGFEKDKDTAMMYFEKAANKGYCLSICWLMSIYIDEDNREKVEYWREKLMESATKDPRAAELIEQEYNNYIKGKNNEQ